MTSGQIKESQLAAAAAGRAAVTPTSLAGDLKSLGLNPGETVIVHSALSQLGWVAGGAHAVVLALMDVLGPSGTLMMPTHSGQLTSPANWRNPPVPEHWWATIREEIPAFDPHLTPTRQMGAVVDCFRGMPRVERSNHPHVSFAAIGPATRMLLGDHQLGDGFGESSPIGQLYALDGQVLLLGVGHGNNTSLHLAEYRANWSTKGRIREGAPIIDNGARRWVEFDELAWNDDDFVRLGDDFAVATGKERRGAAGWGEARLMQSRDVIDYAVSWMNTNR
jgi:aminoglycoside 3-N-acetyltransferase